MVNFLPDMCYYLSMTEYGDQFAEAIAEELRAQKARMGKTNDDIAEEVGLSPVTVLRYLKGQRQIPIDVFGDLCKALGANAADMTRIAYEKAQTASRIAETKRLAHKSDVSLAAYGAEGKDYYMLHDGEASA